MHEIELHPLTPPHTNVSKTFLFYLWYMRKRNSQKVVCTEVKCFQIASLCGHIRKQKKHHPADTNHHFIRKLMNLLLEKVPSFLDVTSNFIKLNQVSFPHLVDLMCVSSQIFLLFECFLLSGKGGSNKDNENPTAIQRQKEWWWISEHGDPFFCSFNFLSSYLQGDLKQGPSFSETTCC